MEVDAEGTRRAKGGSQSSSFFQKSATKFAVGGCFWGTKGSRTRGAQDSHSWGAKDPHFRGAQAFERHNLRRRGLTN